MSRTNETAAALIQLFNSSEHQIKRISDRTYKAIEKLEEQKQKIWNRYNAANRVAETAKIKALERLHKKKETLNAQEMKECAPFDANRTKVQRIIALLKSAVPVGEIADADVTSYDPERRYCQWVGGYLYKSDFLKLRLLIAENDRPKNKFSLVAYGRYAFTRDELIRFNEYYSYGGPNLKDDGFAVRFTIAHVPTVKEATSLAAKEWPTLTRLISTVEQLEKEYRDATSKYALSDFASIQEK